MRKWTFTIEVYPDDLEIQLNSSSETWEPVSYKACKLDDAVREIARQMLNEIKVLDS